MGKKRELYFQVSIRISQIPGLFSHTRLTLLFYNHRAVRYLDRFLGMDLFDMNSHEGWVYHLVSNACQSIAVKVRVGAFPNLDTLFAHTRLTLFLRIEAHGNATGGPGRPAATLRREVRQNLRVEGTRWCAFLESKHCSRPSESARLQL